MFNPPVISEVIQLQLVLTTFGSPLYWEYNMDHVVLVVLVSNQYEKFDSSGGGFVVLVLCVCVCVF